MDAPEHRPPPQGSIAVGIAHPSAILGGHKDIRDFIAFPKNNSGRDVMIDSPSVIADEQLDELNINVLNTEKGA